MLVMNSRNSRPDSLSYRYGSSGTKPSRRLASRVSLTTSKPQTRTRPLVGRNRPTSILMLVVLPAPLGPRNANSSPRGTTRSKPATATFWP